MTDPKSHFIMPEDEWIALCKKQCSARRKQYPDGDCERDGMCSECVIDATDRVPAKYRVTKAQFEQSGCDRLPGIMSHD